MTLLEQLKSRLNTDRRLSLNVKVIPKSSKNELAGMLDENTLRIKVAAPPEKGKANVELCSFLAQQLGVRQQNVEIVRGHTASHKQIVITL